MAWKNFGANGVQKSDDTTPKYRLNGGVNGVVEIIASSEKEANNGVLSLDSLGKYDQRRQKPVPSIADLRNISGLTNNDQVYVSGYYSAGGRAAGWFRWDSALTSDDDGGLIIKPTATTVGRWRRIYDGIIYPEYFGVKGDGTDEGVLLQKALDTGRTVEFEGNRKTYATGQTLFVTRDNQMIDFKGAQLQSAAVLGSAPLLNMSGELSEVRNVRILGSATLTSSGVNLTGFRSMICNFNVLGVFQNYGIRFSGLEAQAMNGKVRGALGSNLDIQNFDANVSNIYSEFGGYGLRTSNFGSINAINIHCFSNNVGFLVEGAAYCQFHACYADTNTTIGWDILNSSVNKFIDCWGYKTTAGADIRERGTSGNNAFIGCDTNGNTSPIIDVPNDWIFNSISNRSTFIGCRAERGLGNYLGTETIVGCFGAFEPYNQVRGINTGDETAASVFSKLDYREDSATVLTTPILSSGLYTINLPHLIGRKLLSVQKNNISFIPLEYDIITNGQVYHNPITGDLSFTQSFFAGESIIITSFPSTVVNVPYIKDTFDRTPSTAITLQGSSTTSAKITKTWDVTSSDGLGVFSTESGGVKATAGTQRTLAAIDTGCSNFTVQCSAITIKTSGTVADRYMAMAFRAIDRSNLWYVTRSNASVWRIAKLVAGVNTTVFTTAVTPATGDIIKVVCNGNKILVYINDVLQTTITDSEFINETKVGFLGQGATDSTSRWGEISFDNIEFANAIETASGWANYVDNVYTTGSPLTVNSGVTTILTNNAATVLNTQLPIGVTSFYDSATSKITPSLNGDSYLINVRFKALSNNANGLLDVLLDIGGALNVIDAETVSLRKGTGVEQQVNVVFDIYSAATFLANGGLIKVNSIVGNTEIYDIQYKITRTHKAK